MSTASSGSQPLSRFEQLRFARDIIRQEGEAVLGLADRLGEPFCDAADLLNRCEGNVIVTGMGKAGLIGKKLMATLASTGSSSHFLHPGEAFHGDLGRVQSRDVVLALSFSGETDELTRLLPSLREIQVPVVAIAGKPESTLARGAAVTLDVGQLREACSLGLAPSTSTTAMLAMGDALALVVSRMKGFGPEDFARFHPGGSLGQKLAKVDEVMRPLAECRVSSDSLSVREVIVHVSRPGRRTGATMLVNQNNVLTGIFTDSDLARILEREGDRRLDEPISSVMTSHPTTVRSGAKMSDAVAELVARKLSELPVVDEDGKPIGLIDITDVVGLLPRPENEDATQPNISGEIGVTSLPFRTNH